MKIAPLERFCLQAQSRDIIVCITWLTKGGEVPLTEARLDAARVDKPNSILLYFFEVARFFSGEEL